MRPLLAFATGVTVVAGLRLLPSPPGDPLPGPAQVAAEISQLAAEAPPLQAAAFADGRIDAHEYRQAVAARVACALAGAGRAVEVVGPEPVASGRLLTWRYRVAGGPDPAVSRRRSALRFGVLASIERAWRLSALPQGKTRRAETARLASCLEGHGVEVEGSGVGAVLRAAAQAPLPVGDCIGRHAVLFGL